MNNSKPIFLVILGVVLLSACGGNPTPQPSASATPEVATANPTEATIEAPLPTASGTSDLSGAATTAQPAATLAPVFDLTRTEDNPITDAQQIIEIFEALEDVQRSQPVSPGWYIKLVTYNFSMKIYSVYHVFDTQGNYDLYTLFSLSPEQNKLSYVEEKIDDATFNVTSGTYSYQKEINESCCNLNDPYKDYYENFSETFYADLTIWGKPSSAQWGEWTYAGWFEEEDDGYVFVFKEEATNMKGAYSRDPDTQELRAKKMEITYTGISLLSGHKVWEVQDKTLVNDKEVTTTYVLQRSHCSDLDCFPVDALDFLQENQVIDNSQ